MFQRLLLWHWWHHTYILWFCLFFSYFPVFCGVLCWAIQFVRRCRRAHTVQLQHASNAEWSVMDGGILCSMVTSFLHLCTSFWVDTALFAGPTVFCGMQIFTPHHGIRRCRRICCLPRKTQNCPFFATFISNSRFFGLLFNFTIYKTIKSSLLNLTFMIIVSINGLM